MEKCELRTIYTPACVCVCVGVDEGQTQLVKVKVFSIVESLR